MSKRNPWTAFYWDDWDADTAHLSLTEQGAYLSLLKHYYRTTKPLPANVEHLHRICRASGEQEKSAVDAVVAQFFVLEESCDGETGEMVGEYHNKRADLELLKASEISSKRSDAARSKSKAIAEHLSTQSQPQSHTQRQKREASPLPCKQTDFDERDIRLIAKAEEEMRLRHQGNGLTDEEWVIEVCRRVGITAKRFHKLSEIQRVGATA